MENGYERAYKEIVPAARVRLAQELSIKYGMNETQIAKVLGVAQAAVSKYLNGNYSSKVKAIAEKIDITGMDKKMLNVSRGSDKDMKFCVCTICNSINKFDCKFSAVK